ncbi:MAG: FitA-like ribbon-helix-helix domain-containing protein [Sulfuricella sp.]
MGSPARKKDISFSDPKCYHVCIHIEFKDDIMATMSIRGLDDQALSRLKNQAEQEGSSLNSLVLRLLQGTDTSNRPNALKIFDDLNALAGTWSDEEAQAFERNTAAFSEIDAALWN